MIKSKGYVTAVLDRRTSKINHTGGDCWTKDRSDCDNCESLARREDYLSNAESNRVFGDGMVTL